jgi:D-arabinitol dehydrogenase (NADP+)
MGGAGHVTIAANKGVKMDLARKIEAGDSYIDLDRANAETQWAQIKKDNPCELLILIFRQTDS